MRGREAHVVMNVAELPYYVKTATESAAALDRGDNAAAQQLAEQGLHKAVSTGDTKWIRRFEHLVRLAKGEPIQGAPVEPSSCSFCLATGPRNLVAGPRAFICETCVKRCLARDLEGSGITLVSADDLACSFCGSLKGAEPVYAARGFCICGRCLQVCAELASSRE
jgi:hypothetical protein